MDKSHSDYSSQWFRRILTIRRKYFFERFRQRKEAPEFSWVQIFRWIVDDIIYSAKWGLNIFLELRAYGSAIRKEYGVSYGTQLKRMAYLNYVKRVYPKYFRSYLLFKQDRWEKVDRFAFDQYAVQYQLVNRTHPQEKEILKNKFNFFQHCKTHSIYSPTVIAVFDGGHITYPDNKNIQLPDDDVFVKDLYGKSGQGTKRFYYSKNHFKDNEGNVYSRDDIFRFLKDYSVQNRATVLQKIERNHESWLLFTSRSLATCRLVTAKMPDENGIIPLFCFLRMPVGDSDADNFALGGIASPVHVETGVMGTANGVKPINGKFEFDTHPDTNEQFKDQPLPYFTKLVETAQSVHLTFGTPFMGWDVSMTEKGCCVIEGNIGWGADIVESPHNRPLTETEYPKLFEQWMRKVSD